MKRVICFIQVLPIQESIKVVELELTIGDFQGKGSYSVAFSRFSTQFSYQAIFLVYFQHYRLNTKFEACLP